MNPYLQFPTGGAPQMRSHLLCNQEPTQLNAASQLPTIVVNSNPFLQEQNSTMKNYGQYSILFQPILVILATFQPILDRIRQLHPNCPVHLNINFLHFFYFSHFYSPFETETKGIKAFQPSQTNGKGSRDRSTNVL